MASWRCGQSWGEGVGCGAGEETYSGVRIRSRCAQSPILLFARVSLLLRSSTAGYAPPVRALFRRGVGLSLAARACTQAQTLSVKPSGWIPQSSVAASALQLPQRLTSGSVFTIGVWAAGGPGKRGQAWGSTSAVLLAASLHWRYGMHAGACSGAQFPREQGSHPFKSAIAPYRSVSCASMASCSLMG